MALGWLNHLGGETVRGFSGGSAPASSLNPLAVQAMEEVGVDISGESPKVWTPEVVKQCDVVVSMGCGDTCPTYPGVRFVDWTLEDPAGKSIETVRRVRDEIRGHVEALLKDLRSVSNV
jgi:arsenate reductase (thioredoxin)